MDFPPFAPFPPTSVRKDVMPDEWELCLDAWILLAEGYLLLPLDSFSSKIAKDPSVSRFLSSYVESSTQPPNSINSDTKSTHLKRKCFLLIHRCLSELKQKPPPMLEWPFLSGLGILYPESPSLKPLLQDLWRANDLSKKWQEHKYSFIRSLEDASKKDEHLGLETKFMRTAALLRVCPAYGQFLLLGSDFIDAMSALYVTILSSVKQKLVVITYRCFLSLLDPLNPKYSMLLDHLYGLYSSQGPNPLLSALCSSTPFVRRLRGRIAGPEAIRAEKLIQQLSTYEGLETLPPRRKKLAQSKVSKGKGKQKDEYGHGAFDGHLHVHKMSLVTQIQDLFPNLGSGFVVKLLDEYGEDPEQVIAHLLDDSLPSHLQSLDQSQDLPDPTPLTSTDVVSKLPPHEPAQTLPIRRNVYDNDAFDRLAISPSQIHRGLKTSTQTADSVLQDRSSAPNKAAILSALAAFDSDDDERDDTYDVGDVGGTVDAGNDEIDADVRDNKNEEALFQAWKLSPEVFERDAATRRGKARVALKSETGMTDEAIEGWGVMNARDPRRLRRLEAKFEGFGGQQSWLEKTRYREGEGTDESDVGDGTAGGGGGGGRGRGDGFWRGRGRGRGRGGGSVAGPADERGTQVARQKKDVNKGSRANHNRRDQRARKVARAGFPG